MEPYFEIESAKLYHGECKLVLAGFQENFFDSCVTDAPYGLGFMNAEWDKKIPGPGYWREVLRVLKPGAYILVMGGTRTFHRLVCSIEDAGFEIRDTMMWLYGSGFPKSHNIALGIDKKFGYSNRGRAIPTASTYQACDENRENKLEANPVQPYEAHTSEAKPYVGWGTALKPAYEPICLARKPFKGSVADNVLAWGTGALNIDACRVPTTEDLGRKNIDDNGMFAVGKGKNNFYGVPIDRQGRWPANILHDGSPEVLEHFPQSNGKPNLQYKYDGPPSNGVNVGGGQINCQYNDSGSAARFFYCSKASKAEREAGLSGQGTPVLDGRTKPIDNPYLRGETKRLNTHPTVKPLALMKHLVTLVTPLKGVVLDPFVGSGTTMLAALELGYQCYGIDIVEEYCLISSKKIEGFYSKKDTSCKTSQQESLPF